MEVKYSNLQYSMDRKKLVKKLDTVFSQYIRLRYANNEIAECVTCGKQDHW